MIRCAGGRARAAIALAVGAALTGCAAAPEPAIEAPRPAVEARASVDRAVATTGDVITYRVAVEHEPGIEVEIPEAGAEIAGFRIVEVGSVGPRESAGRVSVERSYQLRADLVGSYVLPPVTVRYRPAAAAGEEADEATVETSAIFVEVESVLPAEGGTEDIRDIKPLRPAPRRLPWLAAAAVLAALAAVAGYLLWRRRAPLDAPAQPAHEIAFRALDALRATDFDDPLAVRRFYFRISEAIRAYVEGRWEVNATDLTCEEILDRIPRLEPLAPDQAGVLEGFLLHTDRVKFAELEPSRDEVRSTYEGALAFVEATRPREGEEAAAGEPLEQAEAA